MTHQFLRGKFLLMKKRLWVSTAIFIKIHSVKKLNPHSIKLKCKSLLTSLATGMTQLLSLTHEILIAPPSQWLPSKEIPLLLSQRSSSQDKSLLSLRRNKSQRDKTNVW